jgi:hypothetical protein
MRFRSEKITFDFKRLIPAFSLAEAVAALMILAMICAGILVAVNNSLTAAADSILKMQAFEVARENLESMLGSASVKESIENGTSEKYPSIQWQNTVEIFYEPITKRLWVRAVCSAEYPDPKGQTAKIELTDWLTDLSKQQIIELLKEKEKEKQFLDQTGRLIETIEEAAIYAGVDEKTIEKWVENGMPVNKDGGFIKDGLDLYKDTDGNPTIEQKKQLEEEIKQNPPEEQKQQEQQQQQLTDEELNQMPFCQRIDYLIEHNSDNVSLQDIVQYFNECLK